MGSLIRNLLKKSREEATDKIKQIDLNDLITREVEFMDGDVNFKHGPQKVLNQAPSLPPISGVYTDFSQVVHNLIQNAMEAMQFSPTGKLTITTQHDRSSYYIRIEDTGGGIPPEIGEKIFDPFFTTKSDKEDRGDRSSAGTGLGLYTCREIIKSYDGTISVENRSGKGVVFTVSLPKQQLRRSFDKGR